MGNDNKKIYILIGVIVATIVCVFIGITVYKNMNDSGLGMTALKENKNATDVTDDFVFKVENTGGSYEGTECYVEGTVREGTVKVGNRVRIFGNGVDTIGVVSGIENKNSSNSASTNDYCKIYFKNVNKEDLKIGQKLSKVVKVNFYSKCKVNIKMNADVASEYTVAGDLEKAKLRVTFKNAQNVPFTVDDKALQIRNNQVLIIFKDELAIKKGEDFKIVDKKGNELGTGTIKELIK